MGGSASNFQGPNYCVHKDEFYPRHLQKLQAMLEISTHEETIMKYIQSHIYFCKYSEREIYLMSKSQIQAHVLFAKHLKLWINLDEKWFCGFCSVKIPKFERLLVLRESTSMLAIGSISTK